MDNILMTYFDELKKQMEILSEDPKTIFLGQAIAFPGHSLSNTVTGISLEKRLEMPVAEDMQMGLSIGLAISGWLPVTIYPRMDFLLLAFNQLVNHLDKFPSITKNELFPKVIIRVGVGSKAPLYPGEQHCQDYSEALQTMLHNIPVYKLITRQDIKTYYKMARESEGPTVLVEYGDLYASTD